jgi:hypothetical protein
VENYPPLREWLTKIEARCDVQEYSDARSIEIWNAPVGRGTFVIVVYPKGQGWDVFTSAGSIKIDETLSDAERRLGWTPPAPAFNAFAPRPVGGGYHDASCMCGACANPPG